MRRYNVLASCETPLYPSKNTLCQIFGKLIDIDRLLLTQSATSALAKALKTKVNKSHSRFGSRGSEVQILSPRPF